MAISDEVKELVAKVNALSEEQKSEFDYETFNDATFSYGLDVGVKDAAVSSILDLLMNTENLEFWADIQEEVNDFLAQQAWAQEVLPMPDKTAS